MSDSSNQAAVIFDIDNTLVDNPTAHMEAMTDTDMLLQRFAELI